MSPHAESTCWTVIHGAARGDGRDREEFARRYLSVVRAYLVARWRSSPCLGDLDDAVQEVFVECFRRGGALENAEQGRSFRPFLYGVVRNVARRLEAKRRPESAHIDLDRLPADDDSQSRAFDRAWAKALLREAAAVQERNARLSGPEALRRVELLRLRFHEGLPIRDIAERWQVDPAVLHHEYARARQEFRSALGEVVAFHHPGSPAKVEQECASLLGMLE
jgi:RNA polymerase sigma-70 factor (ECF subfamily)